MKLLVIFQNFKAPKISLKNYAFFADRFCHLNKLKNFKDFVLKLIAEISQLFRKPYSYLKKTERIQTFKARIALLKKLHFFADRLHFFANRFCQLINLKYFKIL